MVQGLTPAPPAGGMLSRRLAFPDPALEAAWLVHADDVARDRSRKGMLAFGTLLAFGIFADLWEQYEGWQVVAVMRFLVWAPLMLGGGWLVSQPWVKGRVLDVTFAVTVLTTISLLCLMVFAMPRSGAVDYPMYWLVLLVTVHVLAPLGLRRATAAGSVVVLSFLTTMLHFNVDRLPLAANTGVLLFVWGQLVAASWLLESQSRQTFAAQTQLAAARQDSERLLRAILPDAIANRMKSGEMVIADEVVDATVLFSDLVGFTTMSRAMSAKQVVSFLDTLFAAFDELSARHGVDKIKTIGDSYMAVAGTTSTVKDGTERVARLALDMARVTEEIAKSTGSNIKMRIGVHRGPVVAGIIGRSRFSYDLWGDTVNLASRMESHGEPGAIQVSSAVAEVLPETFNTRLRGMIQVKGVGPVETWWLDGGPEQPPDEPTTSGWGKK